MGHQRRPVLPIRDVVVPIRPDSPVKNDRGVFETASVSSDFQSVLGRLAELAKILTGASGSAIAFRGEHGTICRARSGEGAPPVGARVDTNSGISKHCLEAGTPICVGDIRSDPRVDPEVARVIKIRAIAVVPLYREGAIGGILEVFSESPGVFTDRHLKMLEHLARLVDSPSPSTTDDANQDLASPAESETPAGLNLLVVSEPAWRVFFGNLRDLALLRSPVSSADSLMADQAWQDVFVESQIPWKRFFQSICLHVVAVLLIAGLSRIWPRQLVFYKQLVRGGQITYYPPTFPAREGNRPPSTSRPPRALRNQQTTSRTRTSALPAPSAPALASKGYGKPPISATNPVLPAPPDIGRVAGRGPRLPIPSVVAPAPTMAGRGGTRQLGSPGALVVPPAPELSGQAARIQGRSTGKLAGGGGASDIAIVPPSPSINGDASLRYGTQGAGSGTMGEVVGPPPNLQGEGTLAKEGRGVPLGNGVAQIVPPAPSLEGGSNGRGSSGRSPARSLADGGDQVVPPPPSVQRSGGYGGTGRTGSLAGAGNQVVPPPPSMGGGQGGKSAGGGRVGGLALGNVEVAGPPGPGGRGAAEGSGVSGSSTRAEAGSGSPLSGNGTSPSSASAGNSAEPAGASTPGDLSVPPSSRVGTGKTPPQFQDVPLRLISVAWAPPRSSYFSNYEVYIAEKWTNKQAQLIKLVYVFLPYQRRLAEYGFDSNKIRRLRVTRDPSCDESLMQLTWGDDEGDTNKSHADGSSAATNEADRKNMLPCYRTTADDYRRAVSRNQ